MPQGDLLGPFGFTGELHHGDQVYLRARWYHPGSGTFPSRDPFAGFPEMPYSLHAYQYAYSNPVVWTDPRGEHPLACLVPAVADGPLPVGEVVSVVCLVGYGVYAGAVALAGAVAIDTAATTLPDITTPPRTPPLDPGPPEQAGYAGPQLRYPSIEDYMVRSPLTGPEEACWVLPGPMLGVQPWPFTTGAPGEQVSGPVVWMAQFSYTNKDLYTHPSDIAHRRSTELQQAVPAKARGRITMSAGVVENPDGTRQVLIGSSEPGTYLRPGVPQALESGETVVAGVGHAEEKIVKEATANGQKVIAVGAGRPHCPSCVNWITNAGGVTASPRRQP